ncbi:gephyrin-like molybdotransferase Glp [Pokkaliibacter sp. CJK22405]|uniref:molybdopterin molybdotransferase MoeA n=1 Tax=Pokkaliibacter sp. CJK22405 TaxID=3384615 RepID=UPI00398512A3
MSDPCVRQPLKSLDEVLDILLAEAQPVTPVKRVSLPQALGHVLAHDVMSPCDVPPADNSAMDGYAVRIADIAEGKSLLVSARIPAGSAPEALKPGSVARIFTGAEIPAGADAVIMQEDASVNPDTGEVRFADAALKAGQHIRRQGQDITHGSRLFEVGERLGATHLGVLASVGITEVDVFAQLKVAIFSTGDELRMPGEPLGAGQIYNSNAFMLEGLLRTLGCEVVNLGIIPDQLEATVEALKHARASADVIMTTGGVSVGEEDHVKAAVESLGELLMWRLAIKPGKPFAYGKVGSTPFIGLPGNPASALVTFALLARPFLHRSMGQFKVASPRYQVTSGFEVAKAGKRTEFVRVSLRLVDGELTVVPAGGQSSGILSAVARADGLAEVPAGSTLSKGQKVAYLPFHGVLD